ncbi:MULTISPECIES: tetratricopeptide repeat protein [Nostocales]|uniref:Tetratricopeptide repeat protein n=3 Tax=Nostocales TaxID=1161 RepID=A0A8S9TA10_9CYAN|nr:hypothetical protein [Tolypothrix bouteillei]KAF3888462.1 hypothetical protein DA73_0400025495 [Tolypothrix bouteillei VB521301]
MKKTILATGLLLNVSGLTATSALQSPQSTRVVENSLGKDANYFRHPDKSVGLDLAGILVAAGVIFALSSTVCVVCKALNPGKPSSNTTDSQYRKEDLPKATEDSTISDNTQIGSAAYLEIKQKDDQTLVQLNNAIRIHPQDAYLYTKRANFRHSNLGDKRGALEDYTQAINLLPENALFYLWRSQLYYEVGDRLKAMADYNTAIRLAPEDTMYHSFQSHATSGKH